MCSAGGLEIVNAQAPSSGRWLGSEMVAQGTNEITAAQLVQQAGGDYLLTAKGNQEKLQSILDQQVTAAATLAAHSPSGRHVGGRAAV